MTYIGTHNGTFHCDEVFACYMLKKLPNYKDHVIVRTRDPKILETCDVVVDVGGVYSHDNKRYDHHQKEFDETMKTLGILDHTIRLSSAGLIYAHYGKNVLESILKLRTPNPKTIDILYQKLYKNFVESIDAIDNGVEQYDGPARYILASTLASQVACLNPAWNDKTSRPDEQFAKAMKLVGEQFEDRVNYMHNSWLPARDYVKKAIENRLKTHPSGQILCFEMDGGLPYKQHFYEIEKEEHLEAENIAFVIYKDETDGNSWRVQTIAISETEGFTNRISLLWKGLRDDSLEKESGIRGAFFVHVTGFIGGARTKEGALEMAHKSLENYHKTRS